MRPHFTHVRTMLARLGIVLLLFTGLRWLFLLANRSSFPPLHMDAAIGVLVQGLRFDAMSITIANVPFILLSLLPVRGQSGRGYRATLAVLFVVVNSLLLLLCCVDLPFYGFNGKRITRDLLGQAGAATRELPTFMVSYWWVTVLFVALVALLVIGYRRIGPKPPSPEFKFWPRLWIMIACVGLLVLVGRGGWQYQGLSPAHAADHVPVAFAPLVTNSAFTLGYSLAEPPLRERNWFTTPDLDRRMPLAYPLHRDSTDRRSNVVLIIVESLGHEYLSAISGEAAYMPFLDSLCSRSLVLTNAFANAERSNKSMCALLAGIPSFTDDAFMNTAFASDRVDGLGSRLKELGYSTAFFHGGLNGEYKFDSFSKACGFDRYFGKDEFGDDSAYDGHWGVYDEEFLQFTAEQTKHLPEPFALVVFTLSSHDPFMVPPRYKGRFPKGTQEVHESLGYADLSLRRYFDRVSREAWYTNTLFVITGDHTYQYNDHPPRYRNAAGRFAVPILFFRPDGSMRGLDDRIAQHLDLMPSILDLVGYEGVIGAFGQSVFRHDRTDRAVHMLGGQYQLIQNGRALLFDGKGPDGLYDFRTDTLFARDLRALEPDTLQRMVEDLQAIIQRHGRALMENELVPP